MNLEIKDIYMIFRIECEDFSISVKDLEIYLGSVSLGFQFLFFY